jgi:hypothetical protein
MYRNIPTARPEGRQLGGFALGMATGASSNTARKEVARP